MAPAACGNRPRVVVDLGPGGRGLGSGRPLRSAAAFGTVPGHVGGRRRHPSRRPRRGHPHPQPTSRCGADSELRAALAAAVDAADVHARGFVVTIGEMQLAPRDELGQLAAVLRRATEAAWSLVVVGAGLAGMRDPSRTVSYFERAEWHAIGSLDPHQTASRSKAQPTPRADPSTMTPSPYWPTDRRLPLRGSVVRSSRLAACRRTRTVLTWPPNGRRKARRNNSRSACTPTGGRGQ